MAETADYTPGQWAGYNFASARKAFDVNAGRSYATAMASDIKPSEHVPTEIKTESDAPLVIICDVTGSMDEWPRTIFSKLPYLDLEGKEYLGKGMEISFAAITDAFASENRIPLQVRQFVSGKALETELAKLVIEGGGGGNSMESYDLAALYYARNCQMPNAVHPILIFIGDEGLYDFVDKEHAKNWCHLDVSGRPSIEDTFAELKAKFEVFIVRKPYNCSGNSRSDVDVKIEKQWAGLLGDDHVAILPDPSRIVDVIFGLLAKVTGRVDYFKKELKDRQRPDQVDVVMKSLHTIHTLPEPDSKKAPKKSMKRLPAAGSPSMTRRKAGDASKDSISLV
jgi:hypothetical protein